MSLATMLLIVVFAGIVYWAFPRKRKQRFGRDAQIPFDDGKD
jgi:cbb3-type cytochrome oxidase subunit 3